MSKVFITALLLVELTGLAYGLFLISTDNSTLDNELKTVVMCVLFGGLGGTTYCLRGVYLNACVRKQWDDDWLPWYVIRPIVSLVFGGISYLFIKSGLMLLGATEKSTVTPIGIWALAFLAGLNVDKFLAKIEAIGQTVWGIEPSRQTSPENSPKRNGDRQ